jgi:hypothetical protein
VCISSNLGRLIILIIKQQKLLCIKNIVKNNIRKYFINKWVEDLFSEILCLSTKPYQVTFQKYPLKTLGQKDYS